MSLLQCVNIYCNPLCTIKDKQHKRVTGTVKILSRKNQAGMDHARETKFSVDSASSFRMPVLINVRSPVEIKMSVRLLKNLIEQGPRETGSMKVAVYYATCIG